MLRVYCVLLLCLGLACTVSGLNCFICDDCSLGHSRVTTCGKGEQCILLDLELHAENHVEYRYQRRHCGKKNDYQKCIELGGKLKDYFLTANKIEQYKYSANCLYCDTDFCNGANQLYTIVMYLVPFWSYVILYTTL